MGDEQHPALVVLAAGLGSRYGGFKQLDEIGLAGDTIMDLSIKDAIQAGFTKTVLVINREISSQIHSQVLAKHHQLVEIQCVYQDLDLLPPGFTLPVERKKPWGTAHAILTASEAVSGPFAVINADDFYGLSAYQQMKNELVTLEPDSSDYCMIGYRLFNTLSTHGGVSRGLCDVSGEYLSSVKEFSNIQQKNNSISGETAGKSFELSAESMVSMNFWGFTPKIFELLENRFVAFLQDNLESPNAEFFIPDVLDYAINNNLGRVKVLPTSERWFGVTFREDRDEVKKGIRKYLQNRKKRI